MKIYQVGGSVRDEILGVKSKDIDFTFVYEDGDLVGVDDPFTFMVEWLENLGFKVFLSTPQYLTVRAKLPGKGYYVKDNMFNHPYEQFKGITADFVLARKEGEYSDGRRPDSVIPGTLEDDLARRDFTMNAIAKAEDGSLIDPFNGQVDIQNRIIRTVGDPLERFSEDALRAVRALRFSVTKNMFIARPVRFAMETVSVLDSIEHNISDERIREELDKMFKFDTLKSLAALQSHPALTRAMFAGRVNLIPTMKEFK